MDIVWFLLWMFLVCMLLREILHFIASWWVEGMTTASWFTVVLMVLTVYVAHGFRVEGISWLWYGPESRASTIVMIFFGWAIQLFISLWNLTYPGRNKPRIGWVYSFKRSIFCEAYTRDQAPYGKLVKLLGAYSFKGGFKLAYFSAESEGGTRYSARLAIKATAETLPAQFGRIAEKIEWRFHKYMQDVAREGVAGQRIYDFSPEGAVKVEIQKVEVQSPPEHIRPPKS